MTSKNPEALLHAALQQTIDSVKDGTHVGDWAEVKSYDKTTHEATVQPLAVDSDGSRIGLIHGCRVPKHAWSSIETGDTAFIVYADTDSDNFSGSGSFVKASSRSHDLNDAVIMGVF